MLAPHDGAVHQTCTLEHTYMLRHRRERDLEWLGDLRHERIAFGESRQNRTSCGIGERAENLVKLGIAIFNHTVEYVPGSAAVKIARKVSGSAGV